MKAAKGILLVCAGMLYLLKNAFHYSPLYINIINDLLAIPVFLVVMGFLMKRLYGNAFRMSAAYIFSTVVVISILFEGVFPYIKPNATADAVDVLLYFTGGIIYMAIGYFESLRKAPSTQGR